MKKNVKTTLREKAIDLSTKGFWDAAQYILDSLEGKKPKEYKKYGEE